MRLWEVGNDGSNIYGRRALGHFSLVTTYFVGENTNPTAGSQIGTLRNTISLPALWWPPPLDARALGVVGKTGPGPGKGSPDRTLCGEKAKISIQI